MRRKLVAALLPLVFLMSACGDDGGGGDAQAGGTVRYWLWDSNQLPAYQACADAFQAKNKDIKIKIEQYGWADYWEKVTTDLVAGTAPDVFTNHLNFYPTFAGKNQLLPIDDMVTKDNVDTKA